MRSPQSMESLIGLKMKEKLQWVVWLLITHRRASSIQSDRPMAHDSGKSAHRAQRQLGGDDYGQPHRQLAARAGPPPPVQCQPGLDRAGDLG